MAINLAELDFATCGACPGNVRIFPASMMSEHMDKVHAKTKASYIACEKCHNLFERTSYATARCPKCRRKGTVKKKRFRENAKRVRQMSATGVEKEEGIATYWPKRVKRAPKKKQKTD